MLVWGAAAMMSVSCADLPLCAQDSVAHVQWWDTAAPQTPYHYTRIEQQDDHDILVVGGGDHLTGESAPSNLQSFRPQAPAACQAHAYACKLHIHRCVRRCLSALSLPVWILNAWWRA